MFFDAVAGRALRLVLLFLTSVALTACDRGTEDRPDSNELPPGVSPVQSLSIDQFGAEAVAAAGTTVQLTLRAVLLESTEVDGKKALVAVERDVTEFAVWDSNDSEIAIVSNSPGSKGLVFARQADDDPVRVTGTYTVTANGETFVHTASVLFRVTAAGLIRMEVTPQQATLPRGLPQQLVATGLLSDGTAQNLNSSVTWSSDDTAIAQVDDNGLVSTVGVGTATITATRDGLQPSSATITVTAAELVQLEVTPQNAVVPLGTFPQMKAEALYTDGSFVDVTHLVTWASSELFVATISNNPLTPGRVAALQKGQTVITARFDGQEFVTRLTVGDAVLKSDGLEIIVPGGVNLAALPLGTEVPLRALGTFTDNSTRFLTAEALWTTSDATVASIGNGVTAGGRLRAEGLGGPETITVTFTGVSDTVAVTVTDPALVPGTLAISLVGGGNQIVEGRTEQLRLTGQLTNGASGNFTEQATWVSADPMTVTANNTAGSKGKIVGVMVGGPVTITASGVASEPDETFDVEVIPLTPPGRVLNFRIVANSTNIPLGRAEQLRALADFEDGTTNVDVSNQAEWTSSDTAVATVNDDNMNGGLTAGKSKGTATISAKFTDQEMNDYTATLDVTVTDAVLADLQITPSSTTLPQLFSTQLTATGIFSDSTTRDISASVNWSSFDNQVATVDASGRVTGRATTMSRTVTIEARDPNDPSIFDTATVTVTPEVLMSVAVEPSCCTQDPLQLTVGSKEQFIATGVFSAGTRLDLTTTSTWASARPVNAGVSTVGLVTTMQDSTALMPPEFAISATAGADYNGNGMIDPAEMTTGTRQIIVNSAMITSLTISPLNPSIPLNGSQQFIVTATYDSGNPTRTVTPEVNLVSSNRNVAQIDETGVARPLSAGQTTISANDNRFAGTPPSTVLTVFDKNIDTLRIDQAPSIDIPQGFVEPLSVTARYTDGTEADLTEFVIWNSDNTAGGITVSNASGSKGQVTTSPVSGGQSAVVKASTGGFQATVLVNSINDTVVSITVTAPAMLPAGFEAQAVATARFLGMTPDRVVTQNASWASSRPAEADVTNNPGTRGRVVGKVPSANPPGHPDISATLRIDYNNDGDTLDLGETIVGNATVEVTNATLQSINVTPQNATIMQGRTKQFRATGLFSDGSSLNLTTQVTWTSNDAAVVTVDNAMGMEGLATATGSPGQSTNIVARHSDPNVAPGSTTVTVTSP